MSREGLRIIASGSAEDVLAAASRADDDYNPEAILADPDAPEVHKLYARINIGVRDRGERWSKCANCGQPYMLSAEPLPGWGEPWTDETVCSPTCFKEYLDYLNNTSP